jgi:L-iditol 2-dehydrogenase
MRALVYRAPNDLRLETVPVPKIKPGELLVKVAACGVCPTDIKKIQHGIVPPPRIFGHETAGTIVKTGARVTGFKPGDRVALHHHVPCRQCHACDHRAYAQCEVYKRTGITAGFEPAGGGFADYVRVMSFVLPGVVKIPRANSFLEAALLEPVNTVLKAINRLDLLPGDHVLVAGQGPIGLMFSRLLTLRGMLVVATDLLKHRLQLARQFGAKWGFLADNPHLPQKIKRLTHGRGLDAAIIAVPSDAAVSQAGLMIRGAGKILLFAHTRRGGATPIDLAAICVDEKDLIGSYSSDWTLQKESAQLVFSRALDVGGLITHRFPLESAAAAIALAAKPAADSLKIIVTPG